ncbi:hypothetical protein SAMN04487897_13625 [Paenibacillus sp. yr247]|uniref:hypothetical protein n=1 Tax=Paenibacillus sp. yr247 TaxID=1761880 RepID=UPI00088FD33A|nr:hypothetical protein [Paenibacillus sp. yr247]SDP10091.1 hypothetical protein SAMN04487897_13625 [Paenibacillus sp. yr247]
MKNSVESGDKLVIYGDDKNFIVRRLFWPVTPRTSMLILPVRVFLLDNFHIKGIITLKKSVFEYPTIPLALIILDHIRGYLAYFRE